MHSLYGILGLEENAPQEAVEKAYKFYGEKLHAREFSDDSVGLTQSQKCLAAIHDAYTTLKDPESRQRYQGQWQAEKREQSDDESLPKLGQLCVAAGMISLEDLQQSVERQGALNLPIGEILQEKKLITQAELDGLLLGQKLIQLPPDSPHCIGQRLIGLGLVSEDMVKIALIEQRTFEKRLGELLVAHGWINGKVLEVLMNGHARNSANSDSSAQSRGTVKN